MAMTSEKEVPTVTTTTTTGPSRSTLSASMSMSMMMTMESILQRKLGINFIDARTILTEARMNLNLNPRGVGYFVVSSCQEEERDMIIDEACKIFFQQYSAQKRYSMQAQRVSLELNKRKLNARAVAKEEEEGSNNTITAANVVAASRMTKEERVKTNFDNFESENKNDYVIGGSDRHEIWAAQGRRLNDDGTRLEMSGELSLASASSTVSSLSTSSAVLDRSYRSQQLQQSQRRGPVKRRLSLGERIKPRVPEFLFGRR